MPVPGPRTQDGPVEGYRNPGLESPDRINLWLRPDPLFVPGRSPGTMILTLRGCRLGAGQIRRLWRQSVNLMPAQAAYSWTENAPAPGRPVVAPEGGVGITRALRYMTRSVYVAGGTDHSRFDALHSVIVKRNMYKTVTVNHGQVRNRPTVRNRMSSFGSRVPTLNTVAPAAEEQGA